MTNCPKHKAAQGTGERTFRRHGTGRSQHEHRKMRAMAPLYPVRSLATLALWASNASGFLLTPNLFCRHTQSETSPGDGRSFRIIGGLIRPRFSAPSTCVQVEQGAGEDPLPPHFTSASTVAWARLVLDSYEKEFREPLLDGIDREAGGRDNDDERARRLATAPFGVVSHDFHRSAEDPIFIYGNEVGLRTFGYTWEEFTSMPSRKSAQEKMLQDRSEFLSSVLKREEGAAKQEYTGVRVTKTGDTFLLFASLWNVLDGQGRTVGQAAKVHRTEPIP